MKLSDKEINQIKEVCRELNIDKLFVFGSVLSENFNKNSDIDLLISFADNISIEDYTKNYFLLHYRLRAMLKREVDIITENSLSNPFFIANIESNKMLIYEAGN